MPKQETGLNKLAENFAQSKHQPERNGQRWLGHYYGFKAGYKAKEKEGTKRRTQEQKLKDAVRTLKYYGFISEFEQDSFLMRIKTIKK